MIFLVEHPGKTALVHVPALAGDVGNALVGVGQQAGGQLHASDVLVSGHVDTVHRAEVVFQACLPNPQRGGHGVHGHAAAQIPGKLLLQSLGQQGLGAGQVLAAALGQGLVGVQPVQHRQRPQPHRAQGRGLHGLVQIIPKYHKFLGRRTDHTVQIVAAQRGQVQLQQLLGGVGLGGEQRREDIQFAPAVKARGVVEPPFHHLGAQAGEAAVDVAVVILADGELAATCQAVVDDEALVKQRPRGRRHHGGVNFVQR